MQRHMSRIKARYFSRGTLWHLLESSYEATGPMLAQLSAKFWLLQRYTGCFACLIVVALWLGLYPWPVPYLPAEEAGFIRVVQDHGVWWFEDAAGRKFFSLGVNCI